MEWGGNVITAGQQMASQANANVNKQVFGNILYNVKTCGAKGDGETDDTAAVQATIDYAISIGGKAVFFPHTDVYYGTDKVTRYYVTTLTNADKVIFIGDNAEFVGGYEGEIEQLGSSSSDTSYLVAFNGGGNVKGLMTSAYAIGLSATKDKDYYTVQEDSTFEPTFINGDFDRNVVKDPCLVRVGDMLYMFYSGYSSESGNVYKIGLATLDLTKANLGNRKANWIRHPSFPLDFGLNNYQLSPNVLYEPTDTGKEFKMWFCGGASGFAGLEIYYAYSSDGITWTLYGKVLSLGATGAWDDNFIQPTHIKKMGNTYYLFYAGFKSGERQKSGYATFTNPQGTYTKSTSNPIMTRKSQIQSLTANALIGAKTIKVSSTSAFSAGMTVIIADEGSSNNFEFNKIYSIVNSTDILLEQPMLRGYPTASNATVLGMENGSINIFHVDYDGSQYTVYGTAFQFGNVGTTIGGYLLESTFIAQGESLSTLQFVHSRSPFLGMARSATDYKWDYRSRENPRFLRLDGNINANDFLEFYPDPVVTPIGQIDLIPLRPSGYGATGLSVTSSTFAVQGYKLFPGTSRYPPNAIYTLVSILGVSNVATTAEYRLASDGAGTVYGVAGAAILGRNKVRTTLSGLPTAETIIQEDFRSTDNTNNAIVYSAYIEVSW